MTLLEDFLMTSSCTISRWGPEGARCKHMRNSMASENLGFAWEWHFSASETALLHYKLNESMTRPATPKTPKPQNCWHFLSFEKFFCRMKSESLLKSMSLYYDKIAINESASASAEALLAGKYGVLTILI